MDSLSHGEWQIFIMQVYNDMRLGWWRKEGARCTRSRQQEGQPQLRGDQGKHFRGGDDGIEIWRRSKPGREGSGAHPFQAEEKLVQRPWVGTREEHSRNREYRKVGVVRDQKEVWDLSLDFWAAARFPGVLRHTSWSGCTQTLGHSAWQAVHGLVFSFQSASVLPLKKKKEKPRHPWAVHNLNHRPRQPWLGGPWSGLSPTRLLVVHSAPVTLTSFCSLSPQNKQYTCTLGLLTGSPLECQLLKSRDLLCWLFLCSQRPAQYPPLLGMQSTLTK